MSAGETKQCVFCKREDAKRSWSGNGDFFYWCPLCGRYVVSMIVEHQGEHSGFFPDEIHLVSGYTRNRTDRRMASNSDPDDAVFRNNDDIRHVIENAPKRIQHKADELLSGIIQRTNHFGAPVPLNLRNDFTIGYAKNEEEFLALLQYLQEADYVRVAPDAHSEDAYRYIVTAAGYEHDEHRGIFNSESSRVFVAMRFSDEMNQVWEIAIKPAIEKAGLDPRRVDLEEHNDDVIDRMLGMIKEARFVVADFTEHRNGVYFEAGFARGLGIPVIWCCKSEDISNAHFDTNHFNHIVWTDPTELNEKLSNRILATLGRGPLAVR